MADIALFMNELYVVVIVALAALVTTLIVWSWPFFARNRAERVVRHEPLLGWYREIWHRELVPGH